MRALLCSHRIQSELGFIATVAIAESGEQALVPQTVDGMIVSASQSCKRFQRLLHTFTISARWWWL